MYKVKPHAPELGDDKEAGTLLPVNEPMFSLSYARKLAKEHPEQWERFKELRERILEVAGVENLSELANHADDKKFIEEMRQCILGALAFDENMTIEQRQEAVDRYGGYGQMADEMVEKGIEEYCPGFEYALALRNEIMTTNNVGKLMAIAFDERWNDTVRYEAKRKLRYIHDLVEADKAVNKRMNDLEFLFDLMDDRFFAPNGEKKGGTITKWLKTIHDLNDKNRCLDAELMDEPPSALAENELVQAIDFRTFVAELEDGTEVKLPFMIHPRKKKLGDMVNKKYRKPNHSWDEIARDMNGLHLLAESPEHLELCKRALKQLGAPKLEDDVQYEVKVEKKKNGVGKNGGEKPVIGCDKFNLVIDGDKDYEIQALNFIQYGNYQSLKEEGGAWCIYNILRYFDGNLYRTNWPKDHYPGSPDEEVIKEIATEQAYQKQWAAKKMLLHMLHANGNGNGKAPNGFMPFTLLREDADENEVLETNA